MNKNLIRYENSADYFECPVCRKKLYLNGASLVYDTDWSDITQLTIGAEVLIGLQ